jgi:endonuclease YncB( thermonuclease family)
VRARTDEQAANVGFTRRIHYTSAARNQRSPTTLMREVRLLLVVAALAAAVLAALAALTDATAAEATPSTSERLISAAAGPLAPRARLACHPSYSPCLPIVGDLDCSQIGKTVRVIGTDSYRLDGDHDGYGCESYGSGPSPLPPLPPPTEAGATTVSRVERVIDGDTIEVRNGERVRLVQIDTPEVYFGTECYGPAASAQTKRLLPAGTKVRLVTEPATDLIDGYGRLLRYVVRVNDGVNVNIRLVAVGAAAPYFYERRRGRYANRLEDLSKRAKAKKLGLWRACPGTAYNPNDGIQTRR